MNPTRPARPKRLPLARAAAIACLCIASCPDHASAVTLESLNGVRIEAIVTGTQKYLVKGQPAEGEVIGGGLIRISGKRVQGSITRTYRYGGQSGPPTTSSISGNIVATAPPKGRAWVFDGTTLTFHDVVEAIHLAAIYRVTLTADGNGCSVRVSTAVTPGQTVMATTLAFAGLPKVQLLESTMASSECHVLR
jgi:hypothetical protein